MSWQMKSPHASAAVMGAIPTYISVDDPRPAREQFDAHYAFAGCWSPTRSFDLVDGVLYSNRPDNPEDGPPDEPLEPLSQCRLRDEVIRFYRHDWVSIEQTDGSFEVARLD
jgi:hypothetical protein